jgi:hypothetical protein
MLTLAMLFVFVTLSHRAQDLNIGTWKLRGGRAVTIVEKAPHGMTRMVVTNVDSHGNPTRAEWVGKYDGKNYPVKGEAAVDSREFTRVDAYTLTLADTKNGKVVLTGRIVVAPDGKSRSLTTTGERTDAQGNKVSNTAVFDKQ